jgi:hypothetical protein
MAELVQVKFDGEVILVRQEEVRSTREETLVAMRAGKAKEDDQAASGAAPTRRRER